MSYYNPYEGTHFFSFFNQLFLRLWLFISGNLPLTELAADEIQILTLTAIAISSSLVGTFLILRKMTMLANSLSHTILLGIVLAFFISMNLRENGEHEGYEPISINLMLFAALLTGFVTTFLTEFLSKRVRLQEDASIGLVFTSLFALGVVLVTLLTRNMHISTEVVMGNVDALNIEDLKLSCIILLLNLFLTVLCFKEFTITSFDPGLSQALGISPFKYNYLLMAQMSITAIGAFRAVGVLMVLAFITGPFLAARLLLDDLKRVILLSLLFGILASVWGVALSRHLLSVYGLALSTSGIVVCIIVALFLAAVLYKKSRSKRGVQSTKKQLI